MADKDSRAGQRYDDERLRTYLDRVHAAHDAGLEAAFSAPDEHGEIPAIMVGPSEGRLLELLLRMIAAERVVEIGTLAGYSAIRMAAALPATGTLWTIEYEPRHAEVARANIARAGYADRVSVVVGAALEVLPTLEQHGPFDAVFIDADKINYDRYGQWALDNLRSGGLLLGDNAYLFGELMSDSDSAAAMRRFHEQTAQACDSVCVPTPDGLLLGIKR
jgi:caffeoyl-CoA O-methyltransferase